MMKKKDWDKVKLSELTKIYNYDETGNSFIVKVQLEDYRDVYSDWDFSPFLNRDLDDDLTEYLLECSYEINYKYNLLIELHILHQQYNPKREERTRIGMVNYFGYQLKKLKNRKMRVFKDTIFFLVFGSILLLSGGYIDTNFDTSIWLKLLSEGFYIGGWVMLWEMFSHCFFDMSKVNGKMKHFKRLKESEITFIYEEHRRT